MKEQPEEIEIAFRRLIIAWAESLKLDIFCNWLSKKLNGLSDFKLTLIAFTCVIAIITLLHILNMLGKMIGLL